MIEAIIAAAGASLIAGPIGTGAGALAVVGFRTIKPATLNGLLGAAAGVMLAATVFSLLLPALEAGESATRSSALGALEVVLGFVAGAVAMAFAHRFVPHEHEVKGLEGPRSARGSRLLLLVIAVAIHNAPEGMAVGVGAASGDQDLAAALIVGIGLQNMPEGLAVAVAMVATGASRLKAIGIAFATGLVEVLGAVIAGAAVGVFSQLLVLALAFAAGAMLFVITHEVIPEIHRSGEDKYASAALIAGFCAMVLIDALLG
jgi:zinc transporter, ZIP family